MNLHPIKNSPLSPVFLCLKTNDYFGEEKHLGNMNPGKIFYIIKREDENPVGWGSILLTTMERLYVADLKHWIPTVDMKYIPNLYLNDDEIGIKDAWAYYFKPLAKNYTIDDARNSQNVILDQRTAIFCPHSRPDFSESRRWKRIFNKHIHLNQETQIYMTDQWNSFFQIEDRVLGVLARGTDYVALQPKGHPIQPTVETIINKVKEVKAQYKCNKIFLATEDEKIYKQFQNEFKDNELFTVNQDWIEYDGKEYLGQYLTGENQRYLNGLNYLTSMYFLARCNCLVAGRTSAIPIVLCMNRKYDYKYIFDLGVY